MKIIQIFNQYLDRGGEQNSVERMARHLEACGHEVIRFWRASSEWTEGGKKPSKLAQVKLLLNNEEVLTELSEIHDRENPDVWIAHNVVPVVSLGVYGLAKRKNVVFMQWLHNYRPISISGKLSVNGKSLLPETPYKHLKEVIAGEWRGRLSSAVIAYGYRKLRKNGDFAHVAAWVAVSAQMKQIFVRGEWFPERIESLHHSWEMVDEPEGCESEGYFLFLGRIIPEKGIGQLVDIFSKESMSSYQLVIAGGGDYEEELKQRATANIKFAGFVVGDEKRQLISKAKCLLFPSLWEEPLSTIAYESYEQERPIIVSDAGGMKEIVEDGETGQILKAGDEMAWQKAIEELADSKAVEMGKKGRAWLSENVTGQAWVNKFEELVKIAQSRV